MSQKLIEDYTDFVDKVTSEASKSSYKMNERIEYLGSHGVKVSRFANAGHFDYKNTLIVDWHGNVERALELAHYLKIDPQNIILYDIQSKPLDVSIVLGRDWLEKQELLDLIYAETSIN